MTLQFCNSPDGARIAYDMAGSGPTLMLLHGLGKTRLDWHKLGYVDRLQRDFTVITVDLRGAGESSHFSDSADYTIKKIHQDIYAVADAVQTPKFAVLGYSWGGNIARYLGAWSNRVTAAAIIGVPFGPAVNEVLDRYINEFEQKYGHLAQAYRQGVLTEKQRKTTIKGQIPELLACFQAIRGWPAVELDEMRCPTLLLAGSRNENVMWWLNTNPQLPARIDLQVKIIQGLTHAQEFSQIERMLPLIHSFFKQMIA